MTAHSQQVSDSVHVPFRWVWANEATRLAETSIETEDVNKVGLQQDTMVMYMLTDITPTWGTIVGPVAPGSIAISNVDVLTHSVITFDVTFTGVALPYHFHMWMSGNADGDIDIGQPNMSVDSTTPAVPYLPQLVGGGASTGGISSFGIEANGVYSMTFEDFEPPNDVYICVVNPDGTYSIDGPHSIMAP